jgi:hypothetical protein
MTRQQGYVSTELTHFVGRSFKSDQEKQFDLLVKILKSCFLSHPPHQRNRSGNLWATLERPFPKGEMYSSEVICFCDIPTDQLEIHMNKYSQFGLSFSKTFLVDQGANPVFYVAETSIVREPANLSKEDRMQKALGKIIAGLPSETPHRALTDDVPRGDHIRRMKDLLRQVLQTYVMLVSSRGEGDNLELIQEAALLERNLAFNVFSFIKFFDPLTDDEHHDNYYMEREWRMFGNLDFSLSDVARVIVPERFYDRLLAQCPDYKGHITVVLDNGSVKELR